MKKILRMVCEIVLKVIAEVFNEDEIKAMFKLIIEEKAKSKAEALKGKLESGAKEFLKDLFD